MSKAPPIPTSVCSQPVLALPHQRRLLAVHLSSTIALRSVPPPPCPSCPHSWSPAWLTPVRKGENNFLRLALQGADLIFSLVQGQPLTSCALLPILCLSGVLPALTLPRACREQSMGVIHVRELSPKSRWQETMSSFYWHSWLLSPLGICMAYYESHYNTTAQTRLEDGSTDYGIFQINSDTWCRSAKLQEKNRCHVACSGRLLIPQIPPLGADRKAGHGLATHLLLYPKFASSGVQVGL